jgi:predicted component of type VI protein secretion system
MPVDSLALNDHYNVVKHFERGCNFSTSEESVFAVMSPLVGTARNMGKSVAGIINESKINELEIEDVKEALKNKVKDCIPCDLRADFKQALDFKSMFAELIDFYIQYFKSALEQIKAMGDLLSGKNQNTDLCSFLNFFADFVCVPDLQRLIAGLTALMMQLGLELSSLFDLILQLVGPLMMPFFNELINQFNKFVQLAIKPLECIIGAITTQLSKLDYGAFFKNPTNSQIRGTLESGPVVINNAKIDFNPIATAKNIEEHTAILQAEQSLSQLKARASTIDPTNPEAVTQQREQEQAASASYQEALRNKDMTSIGQASQSLTNGLNTIKSFLGSLVKYVKMAVDWANNLKDLLIGDIMKFITKMTGGGTGMLITLQNKLAIAQLISLIKAIRKLLKEGTACDTVSIAPALNRNSNAIIYQDPNGNVVIEEDKNSVDTAVNNAINGIGIGATIQERLNSVIKFTGNPVIDSIISQTAESVTRVKRTVLDCPSRSSASDVEKINQWISELSVV